MLALLVLSLFSVCSLLVVYLFLFTDVLKREPDGSDLYRSVFEVIESRGFIPESHEVTTQDGYVLTMYRIINPLIKPNSGHPVLLQHGFMSNSSNWIVNSDSGYLDSETVSSDSYDRVGNNLGFELAKRGYDVWLGNNRGNRFATKHRTLDPDKDPMFWDFSLDEMIKYDMTSMIDYVLNETKKETLAFVGFSQGVTQILGLLSTELEYNNKIKPLVALAPCFSLKHTNKLIKQMVNSRASIYTLNKPGPLFAPKLVTRFVNHVRGHFFAQSFMDFGAFMTNVIFGYKNLDAQRFPIHFHHVFETTGRKHILHSIYGLYTKFGHKPEVNGNIDGKEETSSYALNLITNKYICLIYSSSDELVTPRHIVELKDNLTVPLYGEHYINVSNMDHLDILFGKNAGSQVYSKVIKLLQETVIKPKTDENYNVT